MSPPPDNNAEPRLSCKTSISDDPDYKGQIWSQNLTDLKNILDTSLFQQFDAFVEWGSPVLFFRLGHSRHAGIHTHFQLLPGKRPKDYSLLHWFWNPVVAFFHPLKWDFGRYNPGTNVQKGVGFPLGIGENEHFAGFWILVFLLLLPRSCHDHQSSPHTRLNVNFCSTSMEGWVAVVSALSAAARWCYSRTSLRNFCLRDRGFYTFERAFASQRPYRTSKSLQQQQTNILSGKPRVSEGDKKES